MSINGVLYKVLSVIVACAFVVMGPSHVAYAQSGVPSKDDAQTGKITVIAAKNEGVVSNPVTGVKFELYKVDDYDVFDAHDWADIKKREKNKNFSGLKTTKVIEFAPSNSDGETNTITVPAGFYVLKAIGEYENMYTDAYFTVPSQDSEGEWSYNLRVYPKMKTELTPTDPEHKPQETQPAETDMPGDTQPEETHTPVDTQPKRPDNAAVQSGGGVLDSTSRILFLAFIIVGVGVMTVGGFFLGQRQKKR